MSTKTNTKTNSKTKPFATARLSKRKANRLAGVGPLFEYRVGWSWRSIGHPVCNAHGGQAFFRSEEAALAAKTVALAVVAAFAAVYADRVEANS